MKRAAFLLLMFVASLGAEEGEKSAVSVQVPEGKSVYVPLPSAIDLQAEVRIQENDQNTSRQGLQK